MDGEIATPPTSGIIGARSLNTSSHIPWSSNARDGSLGHRAQVPDAYPTHLPHPGCDAVGGDSLALQGAPDVAPPSMAAPHISNREIQPAPEDIQTAPIASIAAPHSSTAPPPMSTVDVGSALASIMESLHAFSTQTNITLTGVNTSIGSIQTRLMAVESRPATHLSPAVWPSHHSNDAATSDPAPHSDPATSADAAGPSSHS